MRHFLSIAASALAATSVLADPITFTHSGTASGTLDNVAFPQSAFTITAIGETTRRSDLPFNQGWYIFHTSAQIEIDGLGTFDITSSTRTFVNNEHAIVGFSRAGPLPFDLFNGPHSSEFDGWDMLTSIGPLTGTGHTLQWSILSAPNISTNAGVLRLSDNATDASFSAVIIPSPGSISVLIAGVIAMRRWRR